MPSNPDSKVGLLRAEARSAAPQPQVIMVSSAMHAVVAPGALPAAQLPVLGTKFWDNGRGLFDCFDDWRVACCGICCPCVLFGRNAAASGASERGSRLLFALPVLGMFFFGFVPAFAVIKNIERGTLAIDDRCPRQEQCWQKPEGERMRNWMSTWELIHK